MKEQNKNRINRVKDYITAIPKSRKMKIAVILGLAVALSVALTVFLNVNKSQYRVLYTNIEATEASNVYQTLIELGAAPKMNAKGEVMVPTSEYDVWLIQLAEKGFPQTALSYDVFASHSGMTTTESENKQWLLYQLQDRIQSTLKRLTGVENAVVTITLPQTSNNVWDQAAEKESGSASVLLTMQPGATLGVDQISGIKSLVAAGIPQMTPEYVTVVDASTSLELSGSTDTTGISVTQNFQFEQVVQKQLEDNITRVLSPWYGASGVIAAAKVTLNYDKMITEKMELQEKPLDEDGNGGGGYPTHTQGVYNIDGKETVGGIVGENDNTDIPSYGYSNPVKRTDLTNYSWETDIDYSYIKTQVEKGNAVLERATVSVMVDESNLTQARQADLIGLISNSTDIAPEFIFVSSFQPLSAEEDNTAPTASFWKGIPMWTYFVLAGVLGVLIVVTIVLVVLKRRRKQSAQRAEELREQEARETAEQEIDAYKRKLSEAAKEGSNAKEDAIVEEVREFATTNPEITASLLRSWLKDGE